MADTDRSETADAHSETAWRVLAEKAIGASLDTLRSRSADGLIVAPLSPRTTTDAPQPWRARSSWAVAQRLDHPDAVAANALALLDLEGGADALVLVGDASPYNRGFDLAAADLDPAFAAVELDFISLRLDAGPGTGKTLAALARLVTDRRLTSAALDVDIGFDPIGWRARLGTPIDDDPRPILATRAAAGLGGTAFLADGRPWHEAGAGEAQELAAVLATGVAYLRCQEALGLGLDAARRNIALLLAADADVGLGLAKFRAMRRLWARVEDACELEPEPVRLHAETSWRMMTRRDPWTNVMRTTAATFAAGLGGVDTIIVLPFTLPLGLPDAAARRLARNSQRVLLDEAHLAKVADPAAGAGAFEALTEGLCEAAWRMFQEIEREGGIARTMDSGALRARIAETARRRAAAIAHRTLGLIGTSWFASLEAPDVEVLNVARAPVPPKSPSALPADRDALPFEALRDQAEALAASGVPPRVFLATFGTLATYGPRASDAANFFATAGLAAIVGGAALDPAEAFAASGAGVACLCGSDAAYTVEAANVAAALRKAGARRVLLVGRPPKTPMDVPGIDAFIHDDCDALHVLGDVLASLSSAARS